MKQKSPRFFNNEEYRDDIKIYRVTTLLHPYLAARALIGAHDTPAI